MKKKDDSAKEARAAYKVDRRKDSGPTRHALEQYVVDHEGNTIGVILPVEQYEQMKEDLHDLAVVAERRSEMPISLEEMKQRLKEDGLL